MRITFTLVVLFLVPVHAAALTVTITVKAEGNDKPTIVGVTNLPDGIDLMVTVSRKESSYMAQDKVKVKGGSFRAGPFSQKGAGLNPGTYSIEVTMPLANLQPPPTWPIIGNEGAMLEGPLAKKSKFGGKIVEYNTSFRVDDGKQSAEKDQAARMQSEKDTHAWWLQSCKDTCNLTRNLARKQNEKFDWDRCYYKCVADEPKKK